MKKFLSVILILLAITSCQSNKKEVKSTAQTTTGTAAQDGVTVGLHPGNKAPEIALPDPNGQVIALSSIKGKLVLIDFWASWCGPCRYENPTLVSAYHKFKNEKFKGGEGFTIYSVSLDADKYKWKSAIEKDGLEWTTHVSDLKFWDCEAAKRYDVKGIPYNVLINDQGIILDRNLRGAALEKALERLKAENK